MVKRWLGIFKRNKRDFSNEELRWQSEKSEKLFNDLFIFETLTAIITCILVLYYKIIWIFTAWMGLSIVVCLTIIYFHFAEKKARFQLNENLKEEKREKILSCIANGEFSKLKLVDEALQQELFQSSIGEIIKIKSIVGYVEVTRKSGSFELIPKYNEALLDTFDIIDDE